MDHLRIIFALESKNRLKHIPSEFEDAVKSFEEKNTKKLKLKSISKKRKFTEVAKQVIRTFF